MMPDQKELLINNDWRAAASGQTMDVVNPATEEVVAQVPSAGGKDLDAAVDAARAALGGPWAAMSARERGRLVRKLGDRLLERADEVARLETLHNGKPISESRNIEIPAASECFE
jgi:acyl-CoA reductase-like NAD-dependent aldehyde dehydrogenase